MLNIKHNFMKSSFSALLKIKFRDSIIYLRDIFNKLNSLKMVKQDKMNSFSDYFFFFGLYSAITTA